MPKTGGYFEPIVFAAVSVSIGTFIRLLFTPETDAARKSISATPMIAVMIPFIGIIALFGDVTVLYVI